MNANSLKTHQRHQPTVHKKNGSTISEVDHINQKQVDSEAKILRHEFAVSLARELDQLFHIDTAKSDLADSPFALSVQDFPDPCPERILWYNIEITRRAIAHACRVNNDPARLLFLASRIAELGAYSIHHPSAPSKPKRFLAASKRLGYFFTPPEISFLIAKQALGTRRSIRTLLDPAAGCGALIGASMILAAREGVRIERVTAIEIDTFTSRIMRTVLEKVRDLIDCDCELDIKNRDAVTYLDELDQNGVDRFDCIVMNPPYGRIKFLRSSLTNAETKVSDIRRSLDEQERFWKETMGRQAAKYRELLCRLGISNGSVDYQRLFIGLATATLESDGRLAFISPSSWLGDRDSLHLRRQLVERRLIEEVIVFPEDAGFFATVNQPTAVTVLAPFIARRSFRMTLCKNRDTSQHEGYNVHYKTMKSLDPADLRIPRLPKNLHAVYDRVCSFSRLRDMSQIVNARGELDQTFGKDVIIEERSKLRLLRGDHIERYLLKPPEASTRPGFIDVAEFESRYGSLPKFRDIEKLRIVGRQCSYMRKERRLSFALVPPRVVLGNSCNYICLADPSQPADLLKALTVVLNSNLLEWYFRIYNSNNHVANYEIDDFPVCLDNPDVCVALARLSDHLHDAYQSVDHNGKSASRIEDTADAIVFFAYGLNAEEASAACRQVCSERADRIAGMVEWLQENGLAAALYCGKGWQQHLSPSLSSLDMEHLRHVPQGGNWQNIPENVPSKRLEQIREMTSKRGVVRTTYYGRLRPDQPAYTIATYYNRPGNGTNIHPWEDRTLSHREAARLQTFPDWYSFLGTDSSVRKQIGNAVPPLLAYAVAKSILPKETTPICVDFFAGAGGLSLGFEMAGATVAAAVEYDRNMAQTYEFNRPCERVVSNRNTHSLFLEADLSLPESRQTVLDNLHEKLRGHAPHAVIGGPPCQGFSHAGWRLKGDKRNDLASIFLEFVADLRPAIVLIENVEGLLTYNQGQVVNDILHTLRDLGYDSGTSPWLLHAEQYGVPQMRRRVFIVGAAKEHYIRAPEPLFEICRGRRESVSTPRLLFDCLPYPVTVAEALLDVPQIGKLRFSENGRRPIRSEYGKWARGFCPTDEMLTAMQDPSKAE
jgi:Alw26I/Eco31I/Esp3I family type II restriction m6 adenine DNA methyltransferase